MPVFHILSFHLCMCLCLGCLFWSIGLSDYTYSSDLHIFSYFFSKFSCIAGFCILPNEFKVDFLHSMKSPAETLIGITLTS